MQSLLNTEQIERATTAIRRALSGLQPGTRIALDDVFAAFIEVRHVTEMRLATQSIASPSVKTGAALNRALKEYRAALTDWDRHLPRLHGWLLAERARLSSRRVHAVSVQSWVETDRQTRVPHSTT
jgi:hypothetical protein